MKWHPREHQGWEVAFAWRIHQCYMCGARFWLEHGAVAYTGSHNRTWVCGQCHLLPKLSYKAN